MDKPDLSTLSLVIWEPYCIYNNFFSYPKILVLFIYFAICVEMHVLYSLTLAYPKM